jgi:hypothetical protein
LGNNDWSSWHNRHFATPDSFGNNHCAVCGVNDLVFCNCPGNYSFVYENTRFISVNSNSIQNFNLIGCIESACVAQIQCSPTCSDRTPQWLETQLINNTSQWTVIMIHDSPYLRHPPYSDSSDHTPTHKQARQKLANLLDKYNVDLVLGGHNHFYGRTRPINRNGQDKTNGTVYITPNTAGKKFNLPPATQPYFAPMNIGTGFANRQPTKQMFTTIRFTATNIRIEAYTVELDGTSTLYDWYNFR